MGVGAQRGVAFVLLIGAGIASLPVAAAALDGEGTENWIVPAQLAGMVLFGALVGAAFPGLAGEGFVRARSVRIGAACGAGAALLGLLLFWFLLNGIDGA